MAYAAAPTTTAAAPWLTDQSRALVFAGDYRAHLALEDPALPMYAGQQSLPALPVAGLRQSAKVRRVCVCVLFFFAFFVSCLWSHCAPLLLP